MNIKDNNISFNHRVIASKDATGAVVLSVHEVYYDEAGRPDSHNEPTIVDGHSINDLLQILQSMEQAISLPILSEDDFIDEETITVYVIGSVDMAMG